MVGGIFILQRVSLEQHPRDPCKKGLSVFVVQHQNRYFMVVKLGVWENGWYKKVMYVISHGGSAGVELITVGKQESRAERPGGCVHNAVLFP